MLDALAVFQQQNRRPQSAGYCSASELEALSRSPASSSAPRAPAASSSTPRLSFTGRVSSPRAPVGTDGVQYLGRSRRAECTLPGAPVNGMAGGSPKGTGGGSGRRLWLIAGERGQLELRVDEARKEDLFYLRTGFEAREPRGSSLEVSLQQKHTGHEQRLLSLREVR